MNKNILKFFQYILSTSILIVFSNSLLANDNVNFKQVEATGRAVLIEGDIETSRKRALEDALYIAALRGGADIRGFSAITSNTVINDQSIVKATNRVLDFKIFKMLFIIFNYVLLAFLNIINIISLSISKTVS